MRNKLIPKVILLFLLFGKLVSAQETRTVVPPLYKYLQDNTDSTLVLTYEKVSNYPVAHFILSKKAEFITLYLYGSPFDRRAIKSIPRDVRNFFQKRDLENKKKQLLANRSKLDCNDK